MKWTILHIVISILSVPGLFRITNTGGQVIKTSENCVNGSPFQLHLSCSTNHRIHVISVNYSKTTKDCEISEPACQVLQETRKDAFSTTCNGLSSCWETFQDYWLTEKCGDVTVYFVTVLYECISDNFILDVCSSTTVLSESGQLYLASPNYFNPVSPGPGKPCTCGVTGTDMEVEILELYLRQMEGGRANITVRSESTVWSSDSHKPIYYNTIVLKDASVVNVTFDSNMKYGQIVWIRMKGSSAIKVLCNGGTNNPVTLLPVPTTNTADGAEETVQKGESSMNTLMIVSVTCGVVIFLLLVIIVSLLIYFKVRSRTKKSPTHYNLSGHTAADISYVHYDHGSVQHDYDTPDLSEHMGGQQVSNHRNGHYRSGHQSDQVHEYSEPGGFSIELEDTAGSIDHNYRGLSNHAYQRD